MGVKIIFIGNSLGGDDGVGPYLYNELKEVDEFKSFELHELGVIGFDLINYVEDDDKLIIVDALKSEKNIGKVVLLDENDLKKDFNLVSQHDFGVEQTIAILQMYKPKLKSISIIGINVKNVHAFSDVLSDELMEKMEDIKNDVVKKVLEIAKNEQRKSS